MTRPPLPRRARTGRTDQTRGRHRRPRRVLDDLPPYMPGGLVAAFGLARRHGTAGAVTLLAGILPWLPAATQPADTPAPGTPGYSAMDGGRVATPAPVS